MRLDPEKSSKNRQCCSGKEEDKQNCTGIYSVGIYLLSVNIFLVIYKVWNYWVLCTNRGTRILHLIEGP